ncbi:825_t:CDS:1, partial [Racocetra persica]
YANLFKKCWSTKPDERPFLDQVLVELNKLSTENTVEFITNHINSGNKNVLVKSKTSANLDSPISSS